MDNSQLLKIAQAYGTPSFVFDTVMLESRMREIKQIVGENVHLCYSIKANPFLLPAMARLTEKLEVCSPGEMQICMDTKVAPETVLVSGVNKTLPDILDAIDYGVRDFTAESPLHVRLLEEAANCMKRLRAEKALSEEREAVERVAMKHYGDKLRRVALN